MAFVGSKTPVSIVNEYFVAKKIVPLFHCIGTSGTPHQPTFVYRVTANEFYADGSGPSKQIAKQNAAQNLLDILKAVEAEEAPQKQTEHFNDVLELMSFPQENRVGHNAVGTLATYCEEKSTPEPVYNLIREDGPAHARSFTMACNVSTLSTHGEGRTKKEAKHQAAFAMITRLKKLNGDEELALVSSKSAPPSEKLKPRYTEMDDEATKKFFELSKKAVLRTKCRANFLSDRYQAYVGYCEKSATLAALVDPSSHEEFLKAPMKTVRQICAELGEEPTTTRISCTSQHPNHAVVFVRLDLIPVLCQGAETEEKAALLVLQTLINFIAA